MALGPLGLLLTLLWLAFAFWYVTEAVGLENLMLLLPQEIALFVIGVVLPLGVLWFILAFFRFGRSLGRIESGVSDSTARAPAPSAQAAPAAQAAPPSAATTATTTAATTAAAAAGWPGRDEPAEAPPPAVAERPGVPADPAPAVSPPMRDEPAPPPDRGPAGAPPPVSRPPISQPPISQPPAEEPSAAPRRPFLAKLRESAVARRRSEPPPAAPPLAEQPAPLTELPPLPPEPERRPPEPAAAPEDERPVRAVTDDPPPAGVSGEGLVRPGAGQPASFGPRPAVTPVAGREPPERSTPERSQVEPPPAGPSTAASPRSEPPAAETGEPPRPAEPIRPAEPPRQTSPAGNYDGLKALTSETQDAQGEPFLAIKLGAGAAPKGVGEDARPVTEPASARPPEPGPESRELPQGVSSPPSPPSPSAATGPSGAAPPPRPESRLADSKPPRLPSEDEAPRTQPPASGLAASVGPAGGGPPPADKPAEPVAAKAPEPKPAEPAVPKPSAPEAKPAAAQAAPTAKPEPSPPPSPRPSPPPPAPEAETAAPTPAPAPASPPKSGRPIGFRHLVRITSLELNALAMDMTSVLCEGKAHADTAKRYDGGERDAFFDLLIRRLDEGTPADTQALLAERGAAELLTSYKDKFDRLLEESKRIDASGALGRSLETMAIGRLHNKLEAVRLAGAPPAAASRQA